MDKGLTVPKWVLIVWPKMPKMPQNVSAQFVCQSPKVLNFNEKRLHWASVVHGVREGTVLMQQAETTDGLQDKCHESIILIK